MRDLTDYTKKDKVVLETLVENLSPCALILHENSTYNVEELKSQLTSHGIGYVELFDGWSPYKLYASRDKGSLDVISDLAKKCWDNPTKSDAIMVEAYKATNFPRCGVNSLNRDYESKINSLRRLAFQLIDLISIFNYTSWDATPKDYQKIREALEKQNTASNQLVGKNQEEKEGPNKGVDDFEKKEEEYFRIATLNMRLSRELPMCGPLCKDSYIQFTVGRILAAKKLGYDLKSISTSGADFTEGSFFDYFWPSNKRNPSLDGLDRTIKAGASAKIKNVADLTKDGIRLHLHISEKKRRMR